MRGSSQNRKFHSVGDALLVFGSESRQEYLKTTFLRIPINRNRNSNIILVHGNNFELSPELNS